MAHSIAVPVISVPPLRNFEHKVKISGFVRGCFRPSTVKSNKVSRYEKSAAVETDPVFFTAARRWQREIHINSKLNRRGEPKPNRSYWRSRIVNHLKQIEFMHSNTLTQVEDFKCFIRVLPIWATTIAISISFAQLSTFFLSQGAVMTAN